MSVRDLAIQQIYARKNHCCYGMGLGIIILDDVYPGFPGDVRNASAYPFPIQYEIAEGVDIQKLVRENSEEKEELLKQSLTEQTNKVITRETKNIDEYIVYLERKCSHRLLTSEELRGRDGYLWCEL